jgi:hypothetical protein
VRRRDEPKSRVLSRGSLIASLLCGDGRDSRSGMLRGRDTANKQFEQTRAAVCRQFLAAQEQDSTMWFDRAASPERSEGEGLRRDGDCVPEDGVAGALQGPGPFEGPGPSINGIVPGGDWVYTLREKDGNG